MYAQQLRFLDITSQPLYKPRALAVPTRNQSCASTRITEARVTEPPSRGFQVLWCHPTLEPGALAHKALGAACTLPIGDTNCYISSVRHVDIHGTSARNRSCTFYRKLGTKLGVNAKCMCSNPTTFYEPKETENDEHMKSCIVTERGPCGNMECAKHHYVLPAQAALRENSCIRKTQLGLFSWSVYLHRALEQYTMDILPQSGPRTVVWRACSHESSSREA